MKYPDSAPITYNPKDGPKLVPWICPDCRETRWIVPYEPAMIVGSNSGCCVKHLSDGFAGHNRGLTWVAAFKASVVAEVKK